MIRSVRYREYWGFRPRSLRQTTVQLLLATWISVGRWAGSLVNWKGAVSKNVVALSRIEDETVGGGAVVYKEM